VLSQGCRSIDHRVLTMASVASHHTSAVGSNLARLGFSALVLATGLVVVFDVFGFASSSRNANKNSTGFGLWVNARVDITNPQALVGWIFVVVGGVFFIEFLIKCLLLI
jgi:hypothetical protein